MRVMLIEDDTNLRTVLGAFFRASGIELLASISDGSEALELLESLHPDVILTDCQMPKMDGISMTRALRARGDQTPIIMMSGQHDPQIRQLALDTGVTQFLDKPVPLRLLSRALTQAAAITTNAPIPPCNTPPQRIKFAPNHAGVAQW